MMNERATSKDSRHCIIGIRLTIYGIAQLKMTDRAAYDRYQARFFDVFRKFSGRLLSSDESPMIAKRAWDRDKLVPMSFPDLAAFGKSEFSG